MAQWVTVLGAHLAERECWLLNAVLSPPHACCAHVCLLCTHVPALMHIPHMHTIVTKQHNLPHTCYRLEFCFIISGFSAQVLSGWNQHRDQGSFPTRPWASPIPHPFPATKKGSALYLSSVWWLLIILRNYTEWVPVTASGKEFKDKGLQVWSSNFMLEDLVLYT